MDKEQYEKIKENYGNVASWLIYDDNYGDYKKNFELIERSVKEILNPKYMFCGLNAARDTLRTWEAFHCKYRGGKGKLLRDTFNNSNVFKGSYVTDFIKKHVNAKSHEVFKEIKINKKKYNENIDLLRQEIEDIKIGKKYPRVFAFGKYTHELLHESTLGRDFKIEYIPHYSAYGSRAGLFIQKIREIEKSISGV